MRVCVYASSSPKTSPAFVAQGRRLGRLLRRPGRFRLARGGPGRLGGGPGRLRGGERGAEPRDLGQRAAEVREAVLDDGEGLVAAVEGRRRAGGGGAEDARRREDDRVADAHAAPLRRRVRCHMHHE